MKIHTVRDLPYQLFCVSRPPSTRPPVKVPCSLVAVEAGDQLFKFVFICSRGRQWAPFQFSVQPLFLFLFSSFFSSSCRLFANSKFRSPTELGQWGFGENQNAKHFGLAGRLEELVILYVHH